MNLPFLRVIALLIVGFGSTGITTVESDHNRALAILKESIERMGLNSIDHTKTLSLEGQELRFLLEQSERPEGPWIMSLDRFTERRDINTQHLQRNIESEIPAAGQHFSTTIKFADGVWSQVYGSSESAASQMVEDPALFPEQILFTAAADPNVVYEQTRIIQGTKADVIQFQLNGHVVFLYVSQDTHLPTGYEIQKPILGSYFFSVWGDIKVQVFFSFWGLLGRKLLYPRQVDYFINDQLLSSVAYSNIKWDNKELSIKINEDIAAKFQTKTSPYWSPTVDVKLLKKVKDGIFQIPNNWNVLLVKQAEGIVVIEAPISSAYSKKVLELIRTVFPKEKIRCLISTSDAWPHLGGVREYVAQGIPVYALDLNIPIIEKLLDSPYKTYPDSLQKIKRKSAINSLAGKTSFGNGRNAIEVIPFRSESGERMMMVYFPGHKLLYSSDLGQGLPKPPEFMTQYFNEIRDAATREHLVIDSLCAMHMGLHAWKEIDDLLENR